MGIIHIIEKSKPKKKPGWKQAAEEQAAYKRRIEAMTSGLGRTKYDLKLSTSKTLKTKTLPTQQISRPAPIHIQNGGCTKKVPRPEILYREDPEMLERELKARERKFNLAPMYNKGPDQLITEEELKNTLRTNRRRP